MTPAISLMIYVSALVVLSFSLLSILKQAHIPFSPLVAALNVLISLWLVLNLRGFGFWLALLLIIINITVIAWMIYQEPRAVMRKQVWAVMAPFGIATMVLFWNDYQHNLRGVTVRVMLSTETEMVNPFIDGLKSAKWESDIAKAFEKETGIIVKIEPASYTVDERLTKYLERLKKPPGKEGEDIDVYAIDVIWPGILTHYAEDLTPAFGDLKKKGFHSAIVANNTVGEKLVAVPWYIDVGLLFYRKSLLKKYKFDEPPKTWDELQEMAMKIQEGEREGGDSFWGFVWQGHAYEGLTCNALEWHVSQGGGFIIDETNKNVSLDGDSAIVAFKRAKGWISTISPPGLLEHKEAHTFDMWQKGKAVFMRNWPYAYAASQAFKEDIGVTLLPKGSGNNARRPAILGGWQLMINKDSKRKEKKAAIKFISFLTSFDAQKSLAIENGKLPALITVYNDVDVLQKLSPIIGDPLLKNLFTGNSEALVARPSTPTGVRYSAISTEYYKTVHAILNGQEARPLVDRLQHDLQTIQSQRTP